MPCCAAAAARKVYLEEVEPGDRAPILRRYLEVAPGARPHLPVDRHAPLAEFERIADQYPVFWIIPAALGAKRGDDRTTRSVRARWSSLCK